MIELQRLFEVSYPKTLVFGHQTPEEDGIPFVTSTSRNNGVAGYVAINAKAKLYPAASITVPLKGSVMEANLQPRAFYCAHQIAVLVPKRAMSEAELLFYVMCLRANRYRYNYGRQADRTLRTLLVPVLSDAPSWVGSMPVPDLRDSAAPFNGIISAPRLAINEWAYFKLGALFEIKKGQRLIRRQRIAGATPFIGAIEGNNGLVGFVGQRALHRGNTITVNYNGNGVAQAFYQPVPFRCSDDVNVLYPKFDLTPFIAVFIATVIRQEKYRFNYGRKWNVDRMRQSEIRLPAKSDVPDFRLMESFIKTLPFSAVLDDAYGE